MLLCKRGYLHQVDIRQKADTVIASKFKEEKESGTAQHSQDSNCYASGSDPTYTSNMRRIASLHCLDNRKWREGRKRGRKGELPSFG